VVLPAPSPAYLDALRTLPNLDILFALAGIVDPSAASDALEKDCSNIREFAAERMVLTLATERRIRTRLAQAFLQAPTTWLQSRYKKLCTCHRSHMVATRQRPGEPIQVAVIPFSCNSPACPTCNRRKSFEYFIRAWKQLSKQLDKIDHLSHLVLTVRNCPWGALSDTVQRLLLVWQRMQHADDWTKRVFGFFWGLEITLNRRSCTWHPHIHVLLHAAYWPKDQLKATWKHLLSHQYLYGNSHIKAATSKDRNIAQAVHECTKYITPGFEDLGTAPPQLWELALALHQLRRKGSGGTLRIPTKPKPEWPFHLEGGYKKTMEILIDREDSVLRNAITACVWNDRKRLLEIATSYPPILWIPTRTPKP